MGRYFVGMPHNTALDHSRLVDMIGEPIIDILGPVLMLLTVVYRRHPNFVKWSWRLLTVWVIWQIYWIWFRL